MTTVLNMESTAFLSWLSGFPPVTLGLFGGLVITLLNGFGAMAVMLWRKPSQRFLDASLGFAAGVMLTASFTSLILPGIEEGGIWAVIVGLALGVGVMDFQDHVLPHLHPNRGREGKGYDEDPRIRRVWLLIIAITIHNMPEGLAVGVGFGSGNLGNAVALMLAIGIQNIPEGFAVAVSALNVGKRASFYAVFVGLRAGLVEVPLAVLGAWAVQLARPVLPYAMGFAAGAMLYVISDEIVPETHRVGHERVATMGTMLGVVVMLYLDVTLG